MNLPAVQFPKGISFEDFLATVDEGTHAEWVDGEVVPMTPPTEEHARISFFVARVISEFVEWNDLGGRVFHAEVEMKLERSSRQPDVLYVSAENPAEYRKIFLDGPGDLAVEVVSPDSRVRDRKDKFREYEKAGVREYWIIDPVQQRAEVYHLSAAGTYEPVPMGDPPRLRSRVLPGLWIDPAWLWAEKMALRAVLGEWGLL
jgi:Uma2 family endonuclease